jgi:hypothetical protein
LRPSMRTSILAAGYDPAKERAWHLSVWASPDVSAWCAHDVTSGRCVALSSDNGATLPDEALLPKRPVSVSFTALPEISTLVPENALAPGSEMRHLKMVHGHLPTGLLRDEPIGALGARCVYLHDEQAEHRLVSRFPHARSLPLQAVLVHAVLARSGGKHTVLIHRSAKRLDLAIARDQQLLLSNTFHATISEDLLYYTLFALEQCGARPEDARCLTCGTHLSTGDEELLARYIQDVAHVIAPEDQRLSGLNVAAPHHFAALLEQFPCAS